MGTAQSKPAGPDLALGIPVDDLSDGRMLAGHVGEEAVLLAHHGDEFFAIGASCHHIAVDRQCVPFLGTRAHESKAPEHHGDGQSST
jgi:nitrite reductase/ring-hydroxylating ferredoxin subunit